MRPAESRSFCCAASLTHKRSDRHKVLRAPPIRTLEPWWTRHLRTLQFFARLEDLRQRARSGHLPQFAHTHPQQQQQERRLDSQNAKMAQNPCRKTCACRGAELTHTVTESLGAVDRSTQTAFFRLGLAYTSIHPCHFNAAWLFPLKNTKK